MNDLPRPTDVITLVFLAWTAGTAVFGVVTRTWREVGAGHFKVIWLVTAALGLAAGFGYRPAWGVAALAVLTYVSIFRGLDPWVGAITAIAALVALGFGGPPFGFAVALLLGAVTNAMLLGHWHLNQPKLGTKPIARLVWALWGSLGTFIAAGALLTTLGGPDALQMLGGVTAIAFTAFSGVLTAMVGHLVKTRSIMSATGILYLEVLMLLVAAFTGSLAALA